MFHLGVFMGFAALLSPVTESVAQTSGADELLLQQIDPALVERLRQRQAGPGLTSQDVTSPVDTVRPSEEEMLRAPVVPPSALPSRLEEDYADRLSLQAPELTEEPDPEEAVPGVPEEPMLPQFGYRMLESLSVAGSMVSAGAINDSYRLGIGDELVITFRGQTNKSYRTQVDREGQVVIPEMPPIPAAGRSFGHFRAVLEQVTSATFLQTEVFLSLGAVRNFPIMVLGQVYRPGVHRVTGVASILDAVVAAGGIQKTGSLRQVRLIRGNEVLTVDLYELLLTGLLAEDITLMEGDRVFVPPIGPTIAVAGDVLRPGIYELSPGQSFLTAAYAIDLAGGTLRPEGYRFLRIATEQEGGDRLVEIAETGSAALKHSDIVLVQKSGYSWEGAFFLDGNVSVPGPRALRFDRTVGSVVNAPDILKQDPYLLFAAVETNDSKTRARVFVPIDLGRITQGRSDVPLKPEDRLLIFSGDDIRYLSSQPVQAVLQGLPPDTVPGLRRIPTRQPVEEEEDEDESVSCAGLVALAAVVSRSRTERFASARLALNPEREDIVPTEVACPVLYQRYPELLPFVLEYVVSIGGEVRMPGIYPIAPGTALGTLVPILGGMSPKADLSQIELTRFTAASPQDEPKFRRESIDAKRTSLLEVALVPGDIVRFNPKVTDRDTGSVLLAGEFRRPGVYTIRRGERLSELIARAGGITEQAYPLGAFFTRESVRRREAAAFERAALDLESGLAEALASGAVSDETSPEALVLAVRELADTLRTTRAVGRVVVEADPTILDVRKEFDTILEPGDRLHMPKRPNSVTVSGEVLNPGTIQFVSGKTVDQYIDHAGGVSRVSDDGRTFVVLPNGEAKTVTIQAWNFEATRVPPGSTIVVPRDPKPFDALSFSVNIAQILSSLAITAASVAVIGRN